MVVLANVARFVVLTPAPFENRYISTMREAVCLAVKSAPRVDPFETDTDIVLPGAVVKSLALIIISI